MTFYLYDVNVPSKCNKQKNSGKIVFCRRLESHDEKCRIWIRIYSQWHEDSLIAIRLPFLRFPRKWDMGLAMNDR
jgi:hypothetical protein